MKTSTLLLAGVCLAGLGSTLSIAAQEFVLVENGRDPAPIVLAAGAGDATRQAAEELAAYIEKISGARPALVTHASGAPPARAIWVGFQPGMQDAFSGVDFKFGRPEEILVVCNGRHLAIAGSDRVLNGQQIEFGTANAVYTFLQKYLDVRWFWPGETGEDVRRRTTIALSSFEYRFHPTLLRRSVFRSSPNKEPGDSWRRFQRLKFDSLQGPAGGHAFSTWWERFHRTHPEWFALQPDGTRGGYPNARNVKMCLSNPQLWQQWIDDAVAALEKDPSLRMFMAGENDGHSSGLCVCKSCRAWDHPGGAPWSYNWQGSSEKYVAMSNRYATFWNQIARLLRARFPDRNDLYVQGLAYGPSLPPPVDVVLEKNIIVSYVGKFPTIDEATRKEQRGELAAWGAVAPNVFYRPNLFYWTGGAWGFPDVTLGNVTEDFQFLARIGCKGIFVDTAQEHWATQGPQYYLMAQLAWDPMQDSAAVLNEYYRRGFGKAAESIRSYWKLMDDARARVTASEGFGPHARHKFQLLKIFEQVYTESFFEQAGRLMRAAESEVAAEPELYRQRVAFVRTGFDFTRLMAANLPLMNRVRENGGKDKASIARVTENWNQIKELSDRAGPVGINYNGLLGKMRGTGYMGQMEDYFGPVSEKLLKSSGKGGAGKPAEVRGDID